MSSSYDPPKDTVDELYVDCEYNDYTFGQLFQRMVDHFGDDINLNDFKIEATKVKVRGCSCCFDLDDWVNYIHITRLTQPSSDVKEIKLIEIIDE